MSFLFSFPFFSSFSFQPRYSPHTSATTNISHTSAKYRSQPIPHPSQDRRNSALYLLRTFSNFLPFFLFFSTEIQSAHECDSQHISNFRTAVLYFFFLCSVALTIMMD